MLAINEPIGRFVALANIDKNIVTQKSIAQDVANLVDLITIRSKDRSIEQIADGLLENIFDLRFVLLEWLADNNKDVKFYHKNINKHISVNLQLAPFSDLAETISNVLINYEKIVSPIFEALPNSFKNIVEDVQKNKPIYDTFKMLSLHPSPQIRLLKDWIDSSLKLELGLILSDLILTNQIEFSNNRIKFELIDFLNNTVIKFGAFSIVTGFWVPDSDNISSSTNDMKILAATIELDNKVFYKTSKEGLFNLVNN